MNNNYTAIIKKFFADNGFEINEEINLFESGVIDSMIVIELVSFIEENLSTNISPNLMTYENLKDIKSINNVIIKSIE